MSCVRCRWPWPSLPIEFAAKMSRRHTFCVRFFSASSALRSVIYTSLKVAPPFTSSMHFAHWIEPLRPRSHSRCVAVMMATLVLALSLLPSTLSLNGFIEAISLLDVLRLMSMRPWIWQFNVVIVVVVGGGGTTIFDRNKMHSHHLLHSTAQRTH